MQLVESYAGPKAHQINTLMGLRNKQRFYTNGARIMDMRPTFEKQQLDQQLDAKVLSEINQQNEKV